MPKSTSRRRNGKKSVNNFTAIKRVQIAVKQIRDAAAKANKILAMVSGVSAAYASATAAIPDYKETDPEIRFAFNHIIPQIKTVVEIRDPMLKETERLSKIRNVNPDQFDLLILDADELLRVAVYEIGLYVAPVVDRVTAIIGDDAEVNADLANLQTFLQQIVNEQVNIPHNVAPKAAPRAVSTVEAIDD